MMRYLQHCIRFIGAHASVQLLLLWFLIVSVRFYPALFEGKVLFFGDNYSLLIPGKIFTANWMKHGIIPLWNPTVMSGVPWIGDISQSIFYPSTLLFMLFNPGLALTVTAVTHMLIALAGMYLLAFAFTKHRVSSLFAAVLWGLSTQMMGNMNNIATLQTLSWAPLIIAAAVKMGKGRAWFWVLVVSLCVQTYAGYPQHVLYTVLGALVFSAYVTLRSKDYIGRWILRWVLAGTLVFLLTAPVTLPFAAALRSSTRTLQNAEQAAVGSAKPLELVKVLVPHFFDNASRGVKWGPSWNGLPNMMFFVPWIGIVFVWTLCTQTKRERALKVFLLVFGGVFLLFSMGENLPGYSAVQQAISFLRTARGPSLSMFLTNISYVLLAAVGMKTFLGKKYAAGRLAAIAGTALVATVLLTVLMTSNFPLVWKGVDRLIGGRLSASVFHTAERDGEIFRMVSSDMIVLLIGFLTALFFLKHKRYGLFLAVIVLDMAYQTSPFVFWGPSSLYAFPDPSFADKLSAPQYRMLTRNLNAPYADYNSYWEALMIRAPFSDSFVDRQEFRRLAQLDSLHRGYTPDWNMPANLPVVNGYVTLLPQDYASIWDTDNTVNVNSVDAIDPDDEKLKVWAVKYYIVDEAYGREPVIFGKLLSRDQNLVLYEKDALSRYRYEDGEGAELMDYRETPNSISFFLANAAGRSWLVAANRFDSSWSATVDGETARIQNIDGMQKIALPGDSEVHEISIVYRPLVYRVGWVLFGLGVFAVILSWTPLWRIGRVHVKKRVHAV